MQALPRDILDHPAIWRGSHYAKVALESIPTGNAQLDAQLPGAGWPRGALTEILADQQGIGEFSLLVPALAQLSRGSDWIVLVAPPHIPYAPALSGLGVDLTRLILIHSGHEQDNLWAAERCLRSKSCGAVIYWASQRAEHTLCRRLQRAAEIGLAWAVVFRAAHWARHASPAALRLMVDVDQDRPRIHLLKRRGGGGQPEIRLDEVTYPSRAPRATHQCPPVHSPSATPDSATLAAPQSASPCIPPSPDRAPRTIPPQVLSARDVDRWKRQVA